MLERNNRNWMGVAVLLIILSAYFIYRDTQYGLPLLIGFISSLSFVFRRPDEHDPNEVDNPLPLVSFTQDTLVVRYHAIPLSKIDRVVLDLQNSKGILHLPYNAGGQVRLVFPAKYLFKLKQAFKQHLPNVTYLK